MLAGNGQFPIRSDSRGRTIKLLYTYFHSSAGWRVRIVLAIACDIRPPNNPRVLRYVQHRNAQSDAAHDA